VSPLWAVSAELIGMLCPDVLLFVVGFFRVTMNASPPVEQGSRCLRKVLEFRRRWTPAGPGDAASGWALFTSSDSSPCGPFSPMKPLTPSDGGSFPALWFGAVLASGVLGFVFLIAVNLAAVPFRSGRLRNTDRRRSSTQLGSVMSTSLLVMVVVRDLRRGLVIMMTGVRLTWAWSRDERFPGWAAVESDLRTLSTPR